MLRGWIDEALDVAAGKGGGQQALAGALFEAWEHYSYVEGFVSLSLAPERMKVMPANEVVGQEALYNEAMLHRLAEDAPGAMITCLRFEPLRMTNRSGIRPS